MKNKASGLLEILPRFYSMLLAGLVVACVQFGMAAQAGDLQQVHAEQPWVAAHLAPIGHLRETQRLNLAICLPLRNQTALSNLLQQIYNPASPNFHHFLTPEQFTEQFGPSRADYQAVIAFARANGFEVTATPPNRMLVDVAAPIPAIEKALHVTLRTYRHPTENRTFYAPDTEPIVDLTVPILRISGLNNYSLPHPRLTIKPLVNGQNAASNAGSGPDGTYMGNDFRAAYVPNVTLNGSGQAIGLLEFDGYTSNDIAYYEKKAGLPSVTLTNVLLDGFGGGPTGDGGEVEVSLDIEMDISMAPGTSRVIVYEAGPDGNWHDILNRMAMDDLAKQMSCSWYIPDGAADPVADQIWQEMAAQGQSFLDASGDNDAYTGLIPFPGDSPYITQVGGTTLSTTGPGGSWTSETVWNWGYGIGSGGGISTQYPIPSWQTNISMTANKGSTTNRDTPDVALTADNVYVRADGSDLDVGGTSCAAPLWAAFTALVNQEAIASGHSTVGFLNPLVYAVGGKAAYASDFRDITTGNNESPISPTRFSAVAGYDLCTGWGTPAGQALIDALANPEPLVITPATGFFSIGGVGGPFTVTNEAFTLTNSGTNTLSWTLANTSAWLNVSSLGGALAASGPATNVTVSLNTTASNLSLGTYTATLAFTNLNDNFGQYRQFTLDIISPPVITLQPTNQAVLDGENATFAAQTGGGVPQYYQWQFNGTNLTDGDGIFGSLTTNLTIAAASAGNVGAYSLIVSNAAGVMVSSNAFLSLIPSEPVITMQPTDETAGENSTAQFMVAAVGTKPIAYQWSFDDTNIVGATNLVLTIPHVQFTNAGEYAVTLTNIHGSVVSSNALLIVTPCDPTPAGIVSWWPGDGNASDIIGTNNGTWFGTAAYGPGEVGQCFVFDGDGSGVSVGNPPTLQLQVLTIEMWLKRGSSSSIGNGTGAVLFGYDTGGYLLWMDENGNLHFNREGEVSSTTGPAITDTNWHHVAVTFSGSTVDFYLDGNLAASVAHSVTFTFTTPAGIGCYADAKNQGFLGSLDEVSVYNRVLTSTEIQDIYVAGSAGKCFTPTAPTITSQPTNQTVYANQTAVFSVQAGGTPPLSYQWTFDSTNIPGATNSVLILDDVQTNNAGIYAVIVSNEVSSTLSSNAVLTVNPPLPCDPVPSGIVSWWPGDGNASDIIGTNNGTLFGNTTYGPGEVGQCFVFDGDGSGVSVGNPPSLQLQVLTIEMWLKRGSSSSIGNGTGAVLFGYDTGGYLLWMEEDGILHFNQEGEVSSTTGPAITDTNWHHVAVTFSGSTVDFYLDGNLAASVAHSVTFTFTTPAGIGCYADAKNQGFLGSLDEVSVYNRVLTSAEIRDIYLAGSGGKCVTPTAPTITSQPTNETVNIGGMATFSVSATGTPPLGYQWTFDATDILGATNSMLMLNDVQLTNAGNYAVVVSNAANSILSSNAVLTVNPLPCDPVPAGIVGWWPGDGNPDDIISGNNGTWIGTSAYAPGEVGQAFNFNGQNSGVDLGNPPGLQLQTLTIEFWLKRSSTSVVGSGGGATLVSYYYGGYAFWMGGSGEIYFNKYGDVAGLPGPTITDTNWHHVAVTYNGSAVAFYLDGALTGTNAYNETFTFTSSVTIGYNLGIGSASFDGLMDEVSIYNRGLTATEIQDIYLAGSGGKCVTPTAPTITSQPTNETVNIGGTATFSVSASSLLPLSYQWTFGNTNIAGATNATLTIHNVQFTNAGIYAVTVSTPYTSTNSSNVVLTVNDILSSFAWAPIPSPQFVNAAFSVEIQALGTTNGLFTNFNGIVALASTNGILVNPVSANFTEGVWTGAVTISQPITNLVMLATNIAGPRGLADAINVLNEPALGYTLSGNYLLMFWPVSPSNFVLETSITLSPPQWVRVGIPPLQIGDENLESIQMNGTNQYFLLQFNGK